MPKETQKTFLVLSNQETYHLATEITHSMQKAGYQLCHICDDPRIIVIVALEEQIKLWPNHEHNAMQWLRELTKGIVFGGYAILYSHQLPSDQQALLKKDENFDADDSLNSTKEKLVLSFSEPQDILRCLENLPEDFLAQDLD